MTGKLTNCIALGVGDMAAAEEFYSQVMGFRIARRTPDWIELDAGGLRLFLCPDDETTPTFELPVPNVAAAEGQLLAHGCTRLSESAGEVYLKDPFGQVFCLSPAE